ncbi:MAG: PIN domain-containing protein [Thiobacillus sp.]|nr:PIN domain-containing protein [Thiobacillus sp.]
MTVSPEVHLDTQVLVWLYVEPQRFWPAPARLLLNEGRLRYAPMARLELRYLFEIGRIKVTPEVLLSELSAKLGVAESDLPYSRVVDAAEHIDWTRDPFDRLIVAQAMAAGAALVTADHLIRDRFPDAVWASADHP